MLNIVCDDFYEVGASGRQYEKSDVIKTHLERYADPNYIDIWKTKDFHCLEIAPNNYLLTYTLLQDKRITKRVTIWRYEDDRWQIFYHQGTMVQ